MKDQHSSWDIRLEHLRVGYGSRVVLDDINAVLPGGEDHGHPGRVRDAASRPCCGTSSGFRGPCRGISFMGGKICSRSQNASSGGCGGALACCFRMGLLLGSLTLAENVGLPLHEHTRLPKATIRSTVLRILDLVGLAEFADYYPNELSGGMKEARRIGPAPLSRSRRCFFATSRPPGSIRSTRPKWISFCWICAKHTLK